MNFARHVSSKDGLLRTELVIGPADPLAVVLHPSQSEQDSPARIGCLRKFQSDLNRRRIELRRRDPIAHKRSTQSHIAPLTRSGCERREISGQHRSRWNKSRIVRWILTDCRALIAAEEEESIFDDRTADRTAKLVAF